MRFLLDRFIGVLLSDLFRSDLLRQLFGSHLPLIVIGPGVTLLRLFHELDSFLASCCRLGFFFIRFVHFLSLFKKSLGPLVPPDFLIITFLVQFLHLLFERDVVFGRQVSSDDYEILLRLPPSLDAGGSVTQVFLVALHHLGEAVIVVTQDRRSEVSSHSSNYSLFL